MSEPLDVTIITGMSGAGRSEAANVLEDLDFFVIDNLPPALITKVADLARGKAGPTSYGLVVDVRSGAFMDELLAALEELRSRGGRTTILFLDAPDEVLVRRFEATRRPHPLAGTERVSVGIARERELLQELKEHADLVIDTGDLNVHELRDRLHELFGDRDADVALQTSVVSFGYKYGLPLDVDMVLDCRFLPNPHWVPELRGHTGLDEPVRDYVLGQPDTKAFLDELDRMLGLLLPAFVREGKSYLSIGIGCTGGHHRSVVLGEELARMLAGHGFRPQVHHRDVDRA